MCRIPLLYKIFYHNSNKNQREKHKNKYVTYLRNYLGWLYETHFLYDKHVYYCEEDWTVADSTSTPVQLNGIDCGVAVLKFVEAVLNKRPVSGVSLDTTKTSKYRSMILQAIKDDCEEKVERL